MKTDHDLRDHLLGDVLRVAHRVLLLLVQLPDLVVDLAPDRVNVLALHLRDEARELALLRVRVELLGGVPVFRGRALRTAGRLD